MGQAASPHETRHVRETIAWMDGARQLDERAVFAVITTRREKRRCSCFGFEQLRLTLVERNRLDALLDARDAYTIRPLEHRRDRPVDALEIALEIGQPRIQIGGRHADR